MEMAPHGGMKELIKSPAEVARVVVLEGDRPGRRVTFDGALEIGRGTATGLQLIDPQVSRLHARIYRVGDHWRIEDMGSRNGVYVDEQRLRSPRRIAFGVRFRVGDSLLLLSHHDALEERVAERHKLEAIGRLGTGIAHDFNNLLGAVQTTLDFPRRVR